MNSVIHYSLNAYWISTHYEQSSALSTGKTAMNKIDQNSCPHGAKYSYGRETGIEDQRDFSNYYIWKFNIMRCLPHKATYIKKLSTCWYVWFYFRNKTSSDRSDPWPRGGTCITGVTCEHLQARFSWCQRPTGLRAAPALGLPCQPASVTPTPCSHAGSTSPQGEAGPAWKASSSLPPDTRGSTAGNAHTQAHTRCRLTHDTQARSHHTPRRHTPRCLSGARQQPCPWPGPREVDAGASRAALTLRLPLVVNALPQMVQPKGFSPVWVRSWIDHP